MNRTNARIKSVLKRAKARIANPQHWCQGEYARTADGRGVDSWSDDATQWCAVGALYKEMVSDDDHEAEYRLKEAAERHGYFNIGKANDEGGHDVIMTIYDDAIAMAGGTTIIHE